MIASSLCLTSRVNLTVNETGLDTLECCIDPDHWRNYPNKIQYHYNSRGYRDAEWPEDLPTAIWCFGDSFTTGVGVPFENIWPQILQQQIQQRTINISMDGASNNWIARKVHEMSQDIQPNTVVIQWSFSHRRELNPSDEKMTMIINELWQRFYWAIKAPEWPISAELSDFDTFPEYMQQEILEKHCTEENDRFLIESRNHPQGPLSDEARRLYHNGNFENNVENTIDAMNLVHSSLPQAKIIHSFIPDFAPPQEIERILEYVDQQHWSYVKPFKKLDLGRDGYHYDRITAQQFCQELIKLI